MRSTTVIAIVCAVSAGMAVTAQTSSRDDRYSLKEPNGISFGEIEGYEAWDAVAPSLVDKGAGQEEGIKLIVANPTMIEAYRSGIPQNGKPFPEGSRIVKILWSVKKDAAAPHSVNVPDQLGRVGLIMKDSKRFPDTHGWGYAQFLYDPATGKFTPEHTDPNFAKPKCHTCHLAVAAKDYIFTDYPVR